jgi:pimeloyl-ACP methyl ester carboxylesterase
MTTTVNANGIALGIESFGDEDAPLVLLAGGTTMLSRPDALCRRLAAGGRRIEVPTLVVHGRRDRFFPVGNGESIAREIPGTRLLVLQEAATEIPDAAVGEVTAAMLTLLGSGGHSDAARTAANVRPRY